MADTPFHEAAGIFPLMDGEALEALADDIRQNDLQIPIELLDGHIIDGRNRYKACLLAGIDPEDHMIEVDPDDPVAYVLSMNLHRRQLTTPQAAVCAQRARKMYDEAAKKRQKQSKGRGQKKGQDNCPDLNEDDDPPGQARDKAGKAFGISGVTVDRARRIMRDGIPEVAEALEAGKLSVAGGVKIVASPKQDQKKLLEAKLDKAITRKPKTARINKRPNQQHISSELVETTGDNLDGLIEGVKTSTYGITAVRKRIVADLRAAKKAVKETTAYLNHGDTSDDYEA